MTLELLFSSLVNGNVNIEEAITMLNDPIHKKVINYFIHRDNITKEPMPDNELSQLNALVNILQIIYNSEHSSPLSDSDYETLHEMLIDNGVSRLTADYETNDIKKVPHRYPQLRGSLDKIHYLTKDEKKTNPSRKYLDDWVKSTESKYFEVVGRKIDLNHQDIIVTPKWDGVSIVAEMSNPIKWLTRGDTGRNLATDVSHIFNEQFQDLLESLYEDCSAIKFEMMMSDEDLEELNKMVIGKPYQSSRQAVSAIVNSKEYNSNVKYITPISLRKLLPHNNSETILTDGWPILKCKLGERNKIRNFAIENKIVTSNKGTSHYRTDGVVLTLADPFIQEMLGRENNINNFEVAYKFTEETGYSTVKNIEFYVSEFGYVTPVLVVEPITLKGNVITRISLSNKERFDELNLCFGDMVKVLYDIIPYAIIDEHCKRGTKPIKFTETCPDCGSELNLNVIQVQCKSDKCPSRLIGRILNWCNGVGISNIGNQSMADLYHAGLLKNGIIDLYHLKDKRNIIESLPGYGELRTNRLLSEIEAKRSLEDYKILGSLGIETISARTFQMILNEIPFNTFMKLVSPKQIQQLSAELLKIKQIGPQKTEVLVSWFKSADNRNYLAALLKCLSVIETGELVTEEIAFSGCRPNELLTTRLTSHGLAVNLNGVTKKSKYLVVPNLNFESNNVTKARNNNIPIITMDNLLNMLGDDNGK